MARIPLTKGKVAIVDDELEVALKNWSWHYSEARRGVGYAVHRLKVGGRWATISMHRFIMSAGERDVVDHINGDKLDNRRANLRIANTSVNSQNSKKQIGASGFRGVYYSKHHKGYTVTITKDNKTHFVGTFENEVDAAKAYDKKAIELFGPDAMTNKKILEGWLGGLG